MRRNLHHQSEFMAWYLWEAWIGSMCTVYCECMWMVVTLGQVCRKACNLRHRHAAEQCQLSSELLSFAQLCLLSFFLSCSLKVHICDHVRTLESNDMRLICLLLSLFSVGFARVSLPVLGYYAVFVIIATVLRDVPIYMIIYDLASLVYYTSMRS